jgi:hypothetical protein
MKRRRMPSWPEYQILTEAQRENLYLSWCWENNRGPESEGSGYAFIESIPWTACGLESGWDQDPDLDDKETAAEDTPDEPAES